MKICILTKNPNLFDDRIYFKIARSLNKIGSVYIINPNCVKTNSVNGIKFVCKNLKRGNSLKWVLKKLDKIDPKIIHVTEPFLLKPAVQYKSIKSVKIIYDPAEDWASMYQDFSRKIWPIPQLLSYYIRNYENWYLSQIDHFISTDEWLFKYYSNTGPCSLIYNYPNKDIFNVDFKSIIKTPYSCVYHGQLRKERGLFIMINAIKIIKKDFSKIKLNLIGNFSYEEEKNEVYNLISSQNLEKNVIISDQIPHSQIPFEIAKNTLGLIPLFDIKKFRRNISMKMFEYNACRLPIVASALPTAIKHINEISCGLCVEPGSSKSLAEGIIYFFNNKKIINECKENGYKAFLKKLQWEFQEDTLKKIYT